ncbi:hypothetical protein EVAR_63404_1 [Eumeta japonica]|uniref:Uncharacterized protein n=1 Tax=Eumeta variegata TaxID=151549 RepID=A0A4C1Z2L1_EUMVA|nr:hypothetical protein EVAR_63404_1 [Eumeta japonica]
MFTISHIACHICRPWRTAGMKTVRPGARGCEERTSTLGSTHVLTTPTNGIACDIKLHGYKGSVTGRRLFQRCVMFTNL